MAPKIFNFSAGPAMLPAPILQQIQQALSNWQGLGSSVMEFSHRSDAFIQVTLEAEQDLRDLLNIPAEYKVLYCQGGARGQFAAVPLNLLAKPAQADYIISGYWSRSARQEAEKYCIPNAIDVTCLRDGMRSIKPMHEWPLSQQSAFIHYCPNETIDGIAIDELPDFGDRIVVADMSSTLLSRPLTVNRFGIIYACAQKNIGPAGITLVIIREDLLGRARLTVPSILNYSLLAQNNSMFNTPPTFAWYCCSLIFKWLKSQGGLSTIAERNQKKAAALYHFIDAHSFYNNNIDVNYRSLMNVPFQLADPGLESLFLQEATATGLLALKGHKAVGGLRASIYNAMPFQGVKALIQFMNTFYQRYALPDKNY